MLPLTGRACSRPRQWKHGHEPARLATWTTYTRRRLQVFSARILSGCPDFCKAIRNGKGKRKVVLIPRGALSWLGQPWLDGSRKLDLKNIQDLRGFQPPFQTLPHALFRNAEVLPKRVCTSAQTECGTKRGCR